MLYCKADLCGSLVNTNGKYDIRSPAKTKQKNSNSHTYEIGTEFRYFLCFYIKDGIKWQEVT